MAVQFVSVKCPECGANLSMEDGRTQMFCSYCGTKIIMSNNNEYIYRHIDEASIKKAEADKEVRMRELEIAEKSNSQWSGLRKALTIIWIILSLIIVILCIMKMAIQGDIDNVFAGFAMIVLLGFPVIGGGGYLVFGYLPNKEKDRQIARNGGITFPKGLEPFEEKNYEAVKSALESAGFENIKCVNLHDVKIRLFSNEGKVESIRVNGNKILHGGRTYLPDCSITISYHGK